MEWFKKLNIKFKIAMVIVGLFLAVFLYIIINKKFLAKNKLNYELARLTYELELADLEEESKLKEEKLKVLNNDKAEILKKIELVTIEEAKIGRDMTSIELESFFNNRGF